MCTSTWPQCTPIVVLKIADTELLKEKKNESQIVCTTAQVNEVVPKNLEEEEL